MLTLLVILAFLWTLFWIVKYLVDWSYATPASESNAFCVTCGNALNIGSAKNSAASSFVNTTARTGVDNQSATDALNRAYVKPLFEAPGEQDDLKVIKGIGEVMEGTLNDLGITTFKQLAGFQEAEIKMVSDRLNEDNAGFGDRIERDEWVQQAKELA